MVSSGAHRRVQTTLPGLYNSAMWEDLLDSIAAPIPPIDDHSFCSVPDR
jgi:hypothetical protein